MPSTADRETPLLSLLSDEELARYGDIARDQANGELSGWGWQVVLAGAALLTCMVAISKSLGAAGIVSSVIVVVGAALALAYSPYCRVRSWTLWTRHYRAVLDEQARRNAPRNEGEMHVVG